VERRVVVGLGNPGADYEGTRHNVGFAVARRLCDRAGAKPHETTRTYASWACDGLLPEDVLVVVDDVYLPLGALRLRARGGDGGHNGLSSIQESLGTDAYARLRIGVGRGDEAQGLADHVLSGFAPEEGGALTAALDTACDASLVWAREGIAKAMNRFNVSVRAAVARDNAPEGER
jgi:PTH1 family peptidyl-tRNA hydrolase